MKEYEIKRLIETTAELNDIVRVYLAIKGALQAQQHNDELQRQIQCVIEKYPAEVFLYNVLHSERLETITQNAINCICFLENLLCVKWGMEVVLCVKGLVEA